MDDSTHIAYMKFQLSIQDFGCGIPEDKLDKIFFDFSKLDN